MRREFLSWTDLKARSSTKNLPIQYVERGYRYCVFVTEDSTQYCTEIWTDTSKVEGINVTQNNTDKTDFETNYKSGANKPNHPIDEYGRVFVRSEGKPVGRTTMFTCIGDSATAIAEGKAMSWDFSNSDDEVTAPTDFKRKRIEFKFLDTVNIKDGAMYYHNAVKASYMSIYVVCPSGQYYYDNDKQLTLASSDTVIAQYVKHHFIQGSVPMGDEVNTETVSSDIPSNYKFWLEVTVPDTDSTSNGWISMELYRDRTKVL